MALAERGWTRWVPYLLLVGVLIAALVVGGTRGKSKSIEERTRSVAATLKCPECTDKSMAASDAPTSVAGRAEIKRQLEAGRSPKEIRSWFEDRYGSSILLTPQRNGVQGLIWVIPVVVIIGASAGLAALFIRWRRVDDIVVDPDDEAIVAKARRDEPDQA